ncbi:MAG: LysM peptidoglycan-binding domain-containing protein [Anaerolineae bacterium]|nr:LysM peptidoglycan-binding domain-containing protein [Anaerolineae bacterium]
MGTFRRLAPIVSIVVMLLLLIGPMPASAETEQTASGPGCSMWYVVKPGDTLNKIAAKYGTTASYLASLNGLANPNFIRSGATLCVRAGSPPPPTPACGYWYTVKPGDTLNKIGQWTGWSAWQLANVNCIPNPDRIYAGQKLWIPCR